MTTMEAFGFYLRKACEVDTLKIGGGTIPEHQGRAIQILPDVNQPYEFDNSVAGTIVERLYVHLNVTANGVPDYERQERLTKLEASYLEAITSASRANDEDWSQIETDTTPVERDFALGYAIYLAKVTRPIEG